MKRLSFAILAMLLSALAITSCVEEAPNPAAGTPNSFASVAVVRTLYKGQDVPLSSSNMMGAYKVGGVVISDATGKNLPAGYVILQNTGREGTRGIALDLGASAGATYAVGDSLVIDITGSTLTKANGSLLIKDISPSNITKVTEGISLTPQTVAIGELNLNFAKYEGTLVQVNADITPLPASGETYSGTRVLDDGSGNTINLFTETTATFAHRKVPASATFIGIPIWAENDTKQLRLRSQSDIKNGSGPIYANFPEDFESPEASAKGSYNMKAIDNNVDLKTGNWKLFQAILANTPGRDRFNLPGAQCIRIQQNLSADAYVQMNFDLPNGASKVTVWYGSYYNDASSTWRLEYSTDGGQTWTQTGEDITDASKEPKAATFMMDISGPVRFRINKRGLGPTSVPKVENGRLSIEDIAIYQNPN